MSKIVIKRFRQRLANLPLALKVEIRNETKIEVQMGAMMSFYCQHCMLCCETVANDRLSAAQPHRLGLDALRTQ